MNANLSWAQFKQSMDDYDAATKHWDFDVMNSSHDELKEGKTEPRRTRVVVSKEYHPDALDAELLATQMVAARGVMPTASGLRY
jgi:hypothetical protein